MTQRSTCGMIANSAMPVSETHTPCRPGTVGSVIKVTSKATDSNGVTLCEVEVYGTQGKIVLLNST